MNSALHHIPRRTKKLPPLRVGIGGPVGSGKPTLLEMLCKAMRDKYDLVAITNDIYTKEDQRLLTVAGALPAERIMGVETRSCRKATEERGGRRSSSWLPGPAYPDRPADRFSAPTVQQPVLRWRPCRQTPAWLQVRGKVVSSNSLSCLELLLPRRHQSATA